LQAKVYGDIAPLSCGGAGEEDTKTMKFANCYSNSKIANNIGDSIIDLALNHIYDTMGIREEDIVRLNPSNLANYSGECVILPIVRPLPNYPEISRAFSANIIPVFINFVLFGPLSKSDVPYLKNHEPIGCRDAYTVSELRRNGIEAYVMGCITACFPRLNRTAGGKVFLVDVQPELEEYIPEEIKKGAVRISHVFPGGLPHDPMLDAQRIYGMYKENARLVITSRLHAASPCMAAGIPVILAKNQYSSRFTWIDRLIPVYDLAQYSYIDWDPKPVEYEEHKARVLRLASARIREAYETYETSRAISEFYEQGEGHHFVTCLSDTIPMIESKRDRQAAFNYSLWGISIVAESVYHYMQENYPQAKLTHVYDKFRRMDFLGLISEPLDSVPEHKDELLIACPSNQAIHTQMREFLELIGKDPATYVLAHWVP
jgi:hypothetical protein